MNIKDGDIFFWSFKETKDNNAYWCKSRYMIANNGRVVDTFWNVGDKYSLTYEAAERLLDLTYLGNLKELERIPDYDRIYYNDEDILCLNHPNSSSGNTYKLKGSQKSKEKMLLQLEKKIEDAKKDIKYSQSRIEKYIKDIVDINNGEDLGKIYI